MFDDFAQKPVASGSIAQIHKARLSARGAHNSEFPQGTTVAVKVETEPACTMICLTIQGLCFILHSFWRIVLGMQKRADAACAAASYEMQVSPAGL